MVQQQQKKILQKDDSSGQSWAIQHSSPFMHTFERYVFRNILTPPMAQEPKLMHVGFETHVSPKQFLGPFQPPTVVLQLSFFNLN